MRWCGHWESVLVGCLASPSHMRGCVYLPCLRFPIIILRHGWMLFPAWGGVSGAPTAPPPGCQSDLLGPFKSSRPSGRHRGVIPACPGWTRVELMLTSGTRPVGPIRPPSAPAPPTRLRSVRPGRGAVAEDGTNAANATGPSAGRRRALPQFPMSRGCAHPDHPRSVRGSTRGCLGGASQDILKGAWPAPRPPPGLCPGNSRWQGEQICCLLERSRDKCR